DGAHPLRRLQGVQVAAGGLDLHLAHSRAPGHAADRDPRADGLPDIRAEREPASRLRIVSRRACRSSAGEARHPAGAAGGPARTVVRAVEGVVAQVADTRPRAAVVGADTGAHDAAEVAGDDHGLPMTWQERHVLAQMGQVTDVAPGPAVARRREGVAPLAR